MKTNRIALISSTVAAVLLLALPQANAQRGGPHDGSGAHGTPPAGSTRPDHGSGQPPAGGSGSTTRPSHPDGAPSAGATPPFGKGGKGDKHGGGRGTPPSGSTPPFGPPSGG